jgi:FMN phosphatase YigB (HAD superfamily)
MTEPAQFYADAATVPLDPHRPLLIADADEVLLRFAAGFDRFLRQREFHLDLVSYRLHGNVKRIAGGEALLDIEVTALLDEFRAELDWLDAVEYAQEALAALKPLVDVVVLSNVTPTQAPARLRNFGSLGFDFPLIVNSGSKGAAVKALAQRAGRPVFFVDDIPQHLASAAESAPDVYRIHLIGDERLKPLLPPSPHAHLRAETWRDVEAFIRGKLAEAR